MFGPGCRQPEGRPLVCLPPGEPPWQDPTIARPEWDVAVVVLSLALHPSLWQDVRELGIPGQARPGRVEDLFVMFPANRQQPSTVSVGRGLWDNSLPYPLVVVLSSSPTPAAMTLLVSQGCLARLGVLACRSDVRAGWSQQTLPVLAGTARCSWWTRQSWHQPLPGCRAACTGSCSGYRALGHLSQ